MFTDNELELEKIVSEPNMLHERHVVHWQQFVRLDRASQVHAFRESQRLLRFSSVLQVNESATLAVRDTT